MSRGDHLRTCSVIELCCSCFTSDFNSATTDIASYSTDSLCDQNALRGPFDHQSHGTRRGGEQTGESAGGANLCDQDPRTWQPSPLLRPTAQVRVAIDVLSSLNWLEIEYLGGQDTLITSVSTTETKGENLAVFKCAARGRLADDQLNFRPRRPTLPAPGYLAAKAHFFVLDLIL